MARFQDSEAGIYVDNAPEGLSKAQQREITNFAKQSGQKGIVDFGEVKQVMSRPPESGSSLAGTPEQQAQLTPGIPSGSARMMGTAPVQVGAEGETTAKGMLDSFIREAAPTVIASAISAPVAVAERITHAVTPYIADFLNDKLNLEGTKWEQMSSQEMSDFIADKLEMERADTEAEKLSGAAGRGVAEGTAMLSAAGMLQTGAPVLGKGNLLQESGKALAEVPTRELLSSTGAEVGTEFGRQVAEKNEMGAFGQTALPLAFGMAGGGLGVGIDAFMNRQARRSIAKSADLPESVAEKIALGESRNVPIMKSDVLPPEDISWRQMQRQKLGEGLPAGTGDPRIRQYNAVKDAVYDELADYGLDENTIKALPAYNSPLLNDFLKVRGDKLSSNVEIKKEVIERLTGEPVPLPKAEGYLKETMEGLSGRSTTLSKRLGQKLGEWEKSLSGDVNGNDLSTLELIRKDLMDELQTAGNEDIASQGTVILKNLYKEINEDMGTFIKNTGSDADFTQWKAANLELAKLSDEFGNVALEEVIEQAYKGNLNPDMMRPEAISDMLFSKDASEVERLYNRLSVEGQGVARTAVMHEIAKDSMDDFSKMSPRQFGVELSNKSAQRGILLDENQRQSLEGLKELIDLTGRSDTVFSAIGGTQVSGSMWKNVATAFTSGDILLSGGAMARLYETPKFRNMMVNLAEMPNTRAGVMQKSELAKRAIDLINTYVDPNLTEEETNEALKEPEPVPNSVQGRTRGIGAK